MYCRQVQQDLYPELLATNADRRNLMQFHSNNWWMAHERALFFMLKSRFLVNLVVSNSPQRPYQIKRDGITNEN